MAKQDFYTDFDYTELLDVGDDAGQQVDGMREFYQLGIDKVYFAGPYPAIFFKEVPDFSDAVLREVAAIQHLAWNYRKVIFLFVLSKTEIRIYNCAKRPFNYAIESVDLADELGKREVANAALEHREALNVLKQVFSRVAVDSGTLWNTDNHYREKVTLQERIDKYLVRSLLETAKALKKSGLADDTIHCLLMRSLFIMYLEDKGAAGETSLYSDILTGASSYIEILQKKEATYALFRQVEQHFNGQVFPLGKGEERQVTREHLGLIRRCLLDGNVAGSGVSLFPDWRLFRFDILQIGLLSEIYENFLEEFREKRKQETGQYYTPPSLVEFILNEKLPVNGETVWRVKVLDPACGSGIFLVEAFKRLVKRWENAHPGEPVPFSVLCRILKENIFGIEIDRLAIRVTTFSLYLALLEQLNPRTLWIDRRYRFPYLINDPADKGLQDQGGNLYRRDAISDQLDVSVFGKIDLLVGNPPFGAAKSQDTIKRYCTREGFGNDMVIPFLHKAVGLAPKGSIALIFNTKILTNIKEPFQKFRQWLFSETIVEKICNFSIFRRAPESFGGQLFSSAVGPVSILFYHKGNGMKAIAPVEYWAPKTYIKNNLSDGVVIDATDIKFLPRAECADPATKIWKIAMWGTLADFSLLQRLGDGKRLTTVLKEQKAVWAVGFRFLNASVGETPFQDKEIPKLPYIRPDAIRRYSSGQWEFSPLSSGLSKESEAAYRRIQKLPPDKKLKTIDLFLRLGKDKRVYKAPHLLIKSGLSNKEICASYVEEDCSFNNKVLGIHASSPELLKAMTALINSKLATYYLFLISASIGIEREEVKPHEIYQLPIPDHQNWIPLLSEMADELITQMKESGFLRVDTSVLERKIDECIYNLFGLSAEERILIEDFHALTATILFQGHQSAALRGISADENLVYGGMLSHQIGRFLGSHDFTVNVSVFSIDKHVPLNLVKLSFDAVRKEPEFFESRLYADYLHDINRYTLSRYARNIYLQKELKYFDGNVVYIVKPNQRRYWSRSAAINDAKELILEIMKMK